MSLGRGPGGPAWDAGASRLPRGAEIPCFLAGVGNVDASVRAASLAGQVFEGSFGPPAIDPSEFASSLHGFFAALNAQPFQILRGAVFLGPEPLLDGGQADSRSPGGIGRRPCAPLHESGAAGPGLSLPAPTGFNIPSRSEGGADGNPGVVMGFPAAPGARRSSLFPSFPKPGSAPPAGSMSRIVQVAQLFKTLGVAGLRLRFSSPMLGVLCVDLCVRQGLIQGQVHAESAAARDLLMAHLDQLKAALESQGLHVGEIQVDVDASFQQASGDASWTGDRPDSGEQEPAEEDRTDLPAPEVPDRSPGARLSFDVTI